MSKLGGPSKAEDQGGDKFKARALLRHAFRCFLSAPHCCHLVAKVLNSSLPRQGAQCLWVITAPSLESGQAQHRDHQVAILMKEAEMAIALNSVL